MTNCNARCRPRGIKDSEGVYNILNAYEHNVMNEEQNFDSETKNPPSLVFINNNDEQQYASFAESTYKLLKDNESSSTPFDCSHNYDISSDQSS